MSVVVGCPGLRAPANEQARAARRTAAERVAIHCEHLTDDGNALKLATGGEGQLKRWKVGCLNKTVAKEHEAIIKTKLLTGEMPSSWKGTRAIVTFREWAAEYVGLEQIKRLKGFPLRKLYVENLVWFFGGKPLGAITPEDVLRYRAQRVTIPGGSVPTARPSSGSPAAGSVAGPGMDAARP